MGTKKLLEKDSVVALKRRVRELEENWKRALADYQNLEKRVKKERTTLASVAAQSLIDKLLGVLDDLERAALHLKDDGLALILTQFRAILEVEGVREIKTEGEEFNPVSMHCLDRVAGPRNKVVRTLRKGYWLGDRVLRPANVEVGRGEPHAAKQEESQERHL